MANLYFDPAPVAITESTRARASQVNAVSQAVETAFDKLPTEEQLKEGTTRYAVDTGTANAYIVTLPYTITLEDGLNLYFKAVNANTGASTINVNGTGVKAIRNVDGTELFANTFGANTLAQVIYNGTSDVWQLLTQSPEAEAAKVAAEAAAANAATSESNAATSESNAATSASNASTSASNASTSETNASTSASNASTSASNAATSETNAAQSFTDFDARYLGSKASDPTLDNDGLALIDGALYWNTTVNEIRVYDLGGTSWGALTASSNATTLDSLDSTQFVRSDVANDIDLELSGAVSPKFQTTDTTNTVVSVLQSTDSQAFIGSTSNHRVGILAGNEVFIDVNPITDTLALKSGSGTPVDALTIDASQNVTIEGTLDTGGTIQVDTTGITTGDGLNFNNIGATFAGQVIDVNVINANATGTIFDANVGAAAINGFLHSSTGNAASWGFNGRLGGATNTGDVFLARQDGLGNIFRGTLSGSDVIIIDKNGNTDLVAPASTTSELHIRADQNAQGSGFQLAQETATDDAFIWNKAATGDLRFGAGNNLEMVIYDGGNIQMVNLPTSNPGGSGLLWNDSGTVKIT